MMSKYCTVEFDGSSKGNPGEGGAGAVIRNSNGDVILRVNKPLGLTTNNAAEYEGLNMGLEKAMEMGYTDVRARGDSKLVCEQDSTCTVFSTILKLMQKQTRQLTGEVAKLSRSIDRATIAAAVTC